MKPILLLFAVLSLLSGCLAWGANPVVAIQAVPPAEPLRAGKTGTVTVVLTIPAPYHINSNRPLEDYLISTQVEFEAQPHVIIGEAVFPPAPVKQLPVSDSPMSVYEGEVHITADVTPDMSLAGSEITLRGRVRYQACDERSCLRPVWQPFSVAMPVVDSAQAASGGTPQPPADKVAAQARAEAAAKPVGTGAVPAPADFGDKSLLVVFLLVFLGGLGLNLTPCVYPMIPITITYFGGQAEGKKGSLLAHSLLYVIGMAITYSILGVFAAMTGSLFGSALQYPPVLIGIALVMGILALSMFDVFELRMPAFLNRLAGSSRKGFAGTFLMGLTVGIVAAPCIGPFVLGLLTYVGNKGSVVLGFSLFFVLAMGLGLPLLVLGLFSGSLRLLPRSGSWMVWVRKIFGFILLAMAIFFLKNIFPSALYYYLALAFLMLLAGIYLAWMDPVAASGKGFTYIRNIVGILFFIAALIAAGTGLQSVIGTAGMRAGAPGGSGSIQWVPYSEAALSRALEQGKPVFLDFYADWCAPCKEMDAHTFSAPEVIERSKEFVMLKADLTSAGDEQVESLRQQFQVIGVPTLVFLRPDGREIADLRGTGFESKEVFLNKMNRALQSIAESAEQN